MNTFVRKSRRIPGQFPRISAFILRAQAVIKPDYVSRGNVAYEVWGASTQRTMRNG